MAVRPGVQADLPQRHHLVRRRDWRHFIEPATRSSSTTSTKALLLGDAVTCPVQLDEATWHSIGDVDPGLAIRTRDRLCRELEATTSPAQEPTFRSSGSDVCSAAAASAGGRDLGRPRR
jgi:hypothetical protein